MRFAFYSSPWFRTTQHNHHHDKRTLSYYLGDLSIIPWQRKTETTLNLLLIRLRLLRWFMDWESKMLKIQLKTDYQIISAPPYLSEILVWTFGCFSGLGIKITEFTCKSDRLRVISTKSCWQLFWSKIDFCTFYQESHSILVCYTSICWEWKF